MFIYIYTPYLMVFKCIVYIYIYILCGIWIHARDPAMCDQYIMSLYAMVMDSNGNATWQW